MAGMSSRERLTAALRRQPVDRIPWTVDLAYYNGALREQGRFDAKYDGTDGSLRQHEELGADPYFCYECFWPWEINFEGVERNSERTGDEMVSTWRIEGAALTGVQRHLPESFCWAPVRSPVETIEELELLLRILRTGRLVPHVQRHREMQEGWGQRGLVSIGVPRTPLPALIVEWCGVTATTFLSVDAPDLFADVLRELDRLHDPAYEALAEYAPPVVHFADNISGDNVGSFWDAHMAPVYRRRIEQLHAAGIVCVIHNDGAVRPVLGRIAEVGFDGAEALTPAPVGDVEPAKLRELAGRDDFVLWGLVPGAMFPPTWTEDAFRDYVRRVLDECEGPMILGSADQIPPDGDVQRVRLVADLIASVSRPSSER